MSVSMDIVVALLTKIDALERRIEALEKDAHPPVDLSPFIEAEVRRQIIKFGLVKIND